MASCCPHSSGEAEELVLEEYCTMVLGHNQDTFAHICHERPFMALRANLAAAVPAKRVAPNKSPDEET